MNYDSDVENFIRTTRLNCNMGRLNELKRYLNSDSSKAYKSIYSILSDLDYYYDFEIKRNTTYAQIDRLIKDAISPNMFKKDNKGRYPNIPFKYQGIFIQLLLDSFDDKSAVSKFFKSHSLNYTLINNVYNRIYEILGQFKAKGKQVCFIGGDVFFSEYFFSSADATYLAALQEIDKMIISDDKKEFYKAAVYANTDLLNDRIIAAARSIEIDEEDDDLDTIEHITYMTEINLEPSPFVFDDYAFELIVNNLIHGQTRVVIDSYLNDYRKLLELQLFVNNEYELFSNLGKILSETSELKLDAEKEIREFISRYKECSEDNTALQREKRLLMHRLRQSTIAKELFNKICKEEDIEIV